MKYEESNLQQKIIDYCRGINHLSKIYWIKNEGKRTIQAGARDKKMGKLAGIPDLFLPVPFLVISIIENEEAKLKCGVYFEIKSKKGKITNLQKSMHNFLQEQGYSVFIIRTFNEFKEITDYIIKNRYFK